MAAPRLPSIVLLATTLLVPSQAGLPGQVPPPPVSHAVTSWTIADGLPQSDVRALALDGDGYLWLATNAGLTRFDGQRFDDYPRGRQADRSGPVWGLTVDAEGNVWALWPRQGVGRIAGGEVSPPAVPELPDFRFHTLAKGNGDTIWVTTATGLRASVRGLWHSLPELPDGSLGEALKVVTDRGTVWVGGAAGLARRSDRSGEVTRLRGVGCGQVRDLAPARDGGVWIATCRGIERAGAEDVATRLVIPTPRGLAPDRVAPGSAPHEVWVGDRSGVQYFKVTRSPAGTWSVLQRQRYPVSGPQADIVSLLADGQGGVWVGTRSKGLHQVRPIAARRLTLSDGLPVRPIHHLAPDGSGGIWIGSEGGLARWRGGRVQVHLPPALGLHSSLILGLLRGRAGGLWVGQPNALVRVDDSGRGRTVLRLPHPPDQSVAPFLEDRLGRIWFGTSRGQVGFLDSAGANRIPSALLPEQEIWSIIEDQAGTFWVGQDSRISRFRDTTLVLGLTERDGVPPGPIRGLVPDRDGSLWIAAYGGGLARWQPGTGVTRWVSPGGRLDRLLSAIQIDRAGRVWLFGDGGVQVYSRAELTAALDEQRPPLPIATASVLDGVEEGNGGHPNTWLDPATGWLWLATVDGVSTVQTWGLPGFVELSHGRIDEVRTPQRSLGTPDSVVLRSGERSLEVWFSAPRLTVRAPTGLRYRLVGREADWAEAGGARVARFGGLGPGTYRFELATARSGRPSPEILQSLHVRVLPRWWETTWARALAALFGLLGLQTGWRRRTSALRQRNRDLQREITDRERAEAAAARATRDLAHVSRVAIAGELATSIAHELNQPLAAIMSDAQRARHLAGCGDPELAPTLETILDQADRAARVIHSLRNFVRRQTTEVAPVDMEALVTATLGLLEAELRERGVRVVHQEDRRGRHPVRGDRIQLQQVLVNILLNAADAIQEGMGDRRIIVIRMEDAEKSVHLSIVDSGPGIPPGRLSEIFDPFHTTKPGGLGLGLSLSRSIVEAHGGRIWAESPPGGGAVFHVVLPVEAP
jgi:signal transduction histidine kinase/streptogramin lyase